jgi:radical SAM-linked protein
MSDIQQYKYEAVFEKKGRMIYISHLDLMTLFRRGIRRAKLPFLLSRGYTPRVKISIPQALKLGVESDSEKMTFPLRERLEPENVKKRINDQMPEGIRISCIRESSG